VNFCPRFGWTTLLSSLGAQVLSRRWKGPVTNSSPRVPGPFPLLERAGDHELFSCIQRNNPVGLDLEVESQFC
jgi:hypothetical protein